MSTSVSIDEAFRLLQRNAAEPASKIFAEHCKTAPDNIRAWVGLGTAHLRCMRIKDARTSFEKAVEIEPTDPAIWHDFAVVLGMDGDFERSNEAAHRALELKPDFSKAYYTLSGNKKFRDDTELSRIETLLSSGERTADEKINLHFAAGKMCDDLGRYDQAFQHYALGNQARNIQYNIAPELNRFEQNRRIFTADLINTKAVAPPHGEGMIFIVGMPRSGTTLLEDLLARHSKVFGGDERNTVNDVVRAIARHVPEKSRYPEFIPQVDRQLLSNFSRNYTGRMLKLSGGLLNVTNKNVFNFREVGLIRTMFPSAKVLHCRRDPLDTCLSCFFQNFKTVLFSFNLKDLGEYYKNYADTMELWQSRIPDFVMDVHYADVVANQEATLRSVIDFLGLDWEDGCLTKAAAKRAVTTASSWQVRQKVHTRSVGKSEKYRAHLGPLEEIIGDEIAAYRGLTSAA